MGMPETTGRWTREMVLALPDDGKRYELFDGELLVTPAPSWLHQRLVMAFYDRLKPYVLANGQGEVLLSPADVPLDGEQVAQPDLFVIPPSAARPPASWTELPNPILVLEVLSPSTARNDKVIKRRSFQRNRIPEYWIADPDARAVDRWRASDDRPEILDERLTWQPSPDHPPLELDLPALFREAWGEG
jgi:Uma2 family endonuclease